MNIVVSCPYCKHPNKADLDAGDNMYLGVVVPVKCKKKGCEKLFIATVSMTPAVETMMVISEQDLKDKKFRTWLKKRLPK